MASCGCQGRCGQLHANVCTEVSRVKQVMCVSFLTTSCVVTKTISVALLLYPGLGLALSESEQWRSYTPIIKIYITDN